VEHPINKDILIQVLQKENQGLKELVRLQSDRIAGVKQYEEIVAKMQANMERKEEIMDQLKKAYTDAITSMEGRLRTLTEQNIELTRQLEELQPSSS